MIPKGLKVGDTYKYYGLTYKVTRVVGENYESIRVGKASPDALNVEQPNKDFSSIPYAQLKKMCAEKGLDATGSKSDLIARLEG